MRGTVRLPLILLAFPLILSFCKAAEGCVCGGWPTSCQAFASADSVFVGTVTSVEQVNPRKDEEGRALSDGQIARVHVEQVFKNMKQTEVVFRAENSDCDAVYKEGQRWLFYAYYDKKGKAWRVRACDRSTLVENGADDLLYLRGLPESAQKTRLSVTLEHYEDEAEGGFNRVSNLSGVKVNLVGAGKTYEVYTNGDGVAVAEGLPAGHYAVEPEVPKGLKLRFPIYFGEVEYSANANERLRSGDQSPKIVLKEKSCASVNFVFSADTSVAGKLLGADGRPLPNVCLSLMPSDKVVRGNWIFDCTDAQGRYELKEIPPGQYVIVVNDEGKVSSNSPFRTAYYPGVFERERAGVLTIIEGSNLKDLDIYIPAQEPTRVLQGVLLFSDGKPAADEFVEFKADSVKEGYDGEANTKTDARGRFSLTVLQGLKGSLRGSMITYEGEYENCPLLDKIIKKMGGGVPEVKGEPLKLEVNADVQDIKLTFPFPSCVKAKRE